MIDQSHGAVAEHAFEEREHLELIPGINRIHDVAAAVGTIPAPDMCMAMLDVVDWIEEVMLPHATWEGTWLYPQFDRLAGTPWATRTMTFEHHQIADVARRVIADREHLRADPSRPRLIELRGDLYALEALLRSHIEREERFLIPLLTGEEAAGVVTS